MSEYTIGELAGMAAVNVESIRYYERRGLIQQPPKPYSGYRRYDEHVLQRVRFVKRAQSLGFSLEEIAELLALRVDAHSHCAEVRDHAEAKVADIDSRIESLAGMKRTLQGLIRSCSRRTPTDICPILNSLESEP
jgi:MerR family mercuric resistance operon transcriptional regulator